MGQKKLSSISVNFETRDNIAKILDLEKKYFNILWELLTSNSFIDELKDIEEEIKEHYDFLQNTWELKNKLKIPAERIVRQYVYRDLSKIIQHIYPSPVSADVAFITNDAVINIDIKTLDKIGNRGDIANLQFENNQSSFQNKNLDVDEKYPNSGVKVESLLPVKYKYKGDTPKPVLTYFFTIVYEDNTHNFSLCRDNDLKTIHLKCLPNGLLSILFDYNIVDNFKTYTYLGKKHGFEPVYLTDDESQVENKVRDFIYKNPEYVLIHGRTKIGAYCDKQIHPKYKTYGVSWFPVKRQDKKDKTIFHYYLEAVYKGNTNRLNNDKLLIRYDSEDNIWNGLNKYKLT